MGLPLASPSGNCPASGRGRQPRPLHREYRSEIPRSERYEARCFPVGTFPALAWPARRTPGGTEHFRLLTARASALWLGLAKAAESPLLSASTQGKYRRTWIEGQSYLDLPADVHSARHNSHSPER